MRIPARPLALLLCLAVASASLADTRPAKVSPAAWDAAKDGPAPVLVVLGARADLAPLRALPDRRQRARAVVAALREVAIPSQAALVAHLRSRGVPHRALTIVNAISLDADRPLLEELAMRPEVARISGDPLIPQGLPRVPDPGLPTLDGGIPWNIARVHAPEAWSRTRGDGVVVGILDTGVAWEHEALKGRYRGWNGVTGDHDMNWHDGLHEGATATCPPDSPAPCDDVGHGTHVSGIVVGDGGADYQIGMAPDAQWIACRNITSGEGRTGASLECFEFFLAPYPIGGTPLEGDPDRAPDITVNSWHCPQESECEWPLLEEALAAQHAAGILTVAAATNGGPACGSIVSPPAFLETALTVGSTNSDDSLSPFSSRGDASAAVPLKPDIVAPGSIILSSTPTGYATMGGTSMAAPHVAGAAALVLAIRPDWRGDPDRTRELLLRTATRMPWIVEDCGGDYDFGPNASWGSGLLDVQRAVEAAWHPTRETACADARDDDGDGYVDCGDPDCAGAATCPEGGRCDDRIDNDLDGRRDCLDSDCFGVAACPESLHCADTLDNDLNGLADCADPACSGDDACPAIAANRRAVIVASGLAPPFAALVGPACVSPRWTICADEIRFAGPSPGASARLLGEADPIGLASLWIYEHSDDGAILHVRREGGDLVLEW